MKTPADGWTRDEREAIEDLREELEMLQARHQHDPEIDLLRAVRHEALPSDVQSTLEHRLTDDPWSCALVDGLGEAEPSFDKDDQDRLLARIRRGVRRAETTPAKRWAWRQPVLASAAVVAVGVAAWIGLRTSSRTPQVAPVPSEQTIAAAPQPPVFQLPIDKPDVALSLAALTWRGDGKDSQLLIDLKAPLDAFREGDYGRAEREFTGLESRYPRAVEVFFYGGVARLFLDDPERAIPALARAGELADETFASRVSWYHAVAEQRAGRLADARRRLDALCRGGGGSDYARQACRAVEQIDSASRTPDAR